MPKRKRKEEDGSKNEVKFKGVSKSLKRFRAYTTFDGKTQYHGTFDTSKEAAQAYDLASIQAGRPTSKLNFLDQVPKIYIPKKKLKSNNTIGYLGVCKRGNRFLAQIYTDGTMKALGRFDTPKEAAEAYDLAAIQAGRPIAKLNFLNQVPKLYKPKKKAKRKKRKSNNTSGFKGVCKRGNRFLAQINVDGKYQHLGTFDTSKEAAEAYDCAAIQAGRPTSKLNFLDQVPKLYKPKKKKLASNNTIGFRGVCKRGNRFEAKIKIGGNTQYLGIFDTIKEAAIAFDLAAIQAKRPKSDLNFPDMIHVEKKVSIGKKKQFVKCTNETSFNGVSKIGKKFRASVSLAGKIKHFGIFTKARDAAMAYDTVIVELSGKSIDEVKSLLNFPNGMEKVEVEL